MRTEHFEIVRRLLIRQLLTKWEKDLKTEFAKTPLLKKVKKVIELIKSAMEQTVMVRNCPDCDGEGSWEDDGVIEVETYDDVDFGRGTANDWQMLGIVIIMNKLILILLMI